MLQVERHFRQRLFEGGQVPGEQDMLALDQSEYGTNLRHDCVLRHVDTEDRVVTDLGCGSGLLLEKMVQRGGRPSYYIGIDMLPERFDVLAPRMLQLQMPGRFVVKPAEVRFEHFPTSATAVGLAVGFVGYWGYHTIRHVKSLFAWMWTTFENGAITFPMHYDDVLGHEGLVRFDPEDIRDALRPAGLYGIEILEREFVLYW